jgi:RNA polymerase sigma factor (sigma-70 family)
MANRGQAVAGAELRALFQYGTAAGLGERQLLDRFIERRDEAAFAALVARHGPMVLGVCRRVLAGSSEIEDAFQGTFLVLVRKAGRLRDRGLVGPWLYGVAYRVASRARVVASRRNARERDDFAEPLTAPDRDDLRELTSIVDEELSRLPEKYRVPVVLCYLEGQTHEEAAAQLRWPLGTVKSRLKGARDRLRDRLARRGLAPAVGGPSAFPILRGPTEVPQSLIESTVPHALQGAGGAATAGVSAARVFILVASVLRGLIMARVRVLAGLGTVVAVAAGTIWAFPWGVAGADDREAARQGPARQGAGRADEQPSPPALLRAKSIPAVERYPWQPAELVGIVGEHAGRGWGMMSSLAVSPDSSTLATAELASDAGIVRLWDAKTLRERAMLRHTVPRINAVAFTPDGKTLIAGGANRFLIRSGRMAGIPQVPNAPLPRSNDDTLYLWDVSTATPVLKGPFEGHTEDVSALAISADGRVLATGGDQAKVRLWDLSRDKPTARATITGFRQPVKALALSRDGHTLAIAVGNSVWSIREKSAQMEYHGVELRVWDLTGDEPRERGAVPVDAKVGIDGLAFHPQSNLLVAASSDRTVRFWDVSQPQPRLRDSLATRDDASVNPFRSQIVALNADGGILAAGNDLEIRLWNIADGTARERSLISTTETRRGGTRIALAPGGKTVYAAVGRGSIWAWDITGQVVRPLPAVSGFEGTDAVVRFTPDGRTLLTDGERGTAVRFWDVTVNPPRVRGVVRAEGQGSRLVVPTLSPDGTILAAQVGPLEGGRFELRLWDVGSGQPRLRATAVTGNATQGRSRGSAWSLAFCPDGKSLALGMAGGTVQRWRLDGGRVEPMASFQDGSTQSVCSVAYSPDGNLVATGNWREVVRLWDLRGPAPQELIRWQGHRAPARKVAFSPDGRTVASCDDAGVIRLWDAETLAEGAELKSDAERRAVAIDSTTLGGGLDFSPDGTMLLASGLDGLVVLWDPKGARERHRWMLPGPVWNAVFAPDGRLIATANGNGTVYILRLPDGLR